VTPQSSPGKLATHVGNNMLNAASACRLALREVSSSWAERDGRMAAIFCSASAMRANSRTNAGPRSLGRRCADAKCALTHHRMRINSAVNGGQSSTSAIRNRPESISFTLDSTRPGEHRIPTTGFGQVQPRVNRLLIAVQLRLAFIAGFVVGPFTFGEVG